MTSSEIRQAAIDAGFDLAGICRADGPFSSHGPFQRWIEAGFHADMDYLPRQVPIRESLDAVLPGARSALVVALNYRQPNPTQPRIAQYALNRDYHRVFRRRLRPVVSLLESAFPGESFRICVDSAPVYERELAVSAGLGWLGKNTLLINPHKGSFLLLASVLTTAKWDPSDSFDANHCGTCQRCIDACPTGALVRLDDRWQLDARRCISYWTIEHHGDFPPEVETHGWAFGCDICQEVCPHNSPRPGRAQPTEDPDFLARPDWPDFSTMTEEEWDRWSAGTPIRRAGYRGLKRNVSG